jgi:hypothetical protein
MTGIQPIEIRAFTALLQAMSEQGGNTHPALRSICRTLSGVASIPEGQAAKALFEHIGAISRLIDEHMTTAGNKRAGARLKVRIAELFSSEKLVQDYGSFLAQNGPNISAILDLMSLLDDVQFDDGKLINARPDIQAALDELLGNLVGSDQIAESTKKVVRGQIYLIKNTLERFEFDGVVPFRDSIFCTVGRLHIELRDADEKQGGAIRKLIDDIIRVKDMVELAGGALLLTGPVIAGLLSAPST